MREELVTIQTLLILWKRWKESDHHFNQQFGQYFFNQTGVQVGNSFYDRIDSRVFLHLYHHLEKENQGVLNLNKGDGCPG